MDEALAWINHRDNSLHTRLQSAYPFPAETRFLNDGFTRKLEYRSHPLREHVKLLLSRRDRHSVDSIEHLRCTRAGRSPAHRRRRLPPFACDTQDRGHGRLEHRHIEIFPIEPLACGMPHMRSLVVITKQTRSTAREGGKETEETESAPWVEA